MYVNCWSLYGFREVFVFLPELTFICFEQENMLPPVIQCYSFAFPWCSVIRKRTAEGLLRSYVMQVTARTALIACSTQVCALNVHTWMW